MRVIKINICTETTEMYKCPNITCKLCDGVCDPKYPRGKIFFILYDILFKNTLSEVGYRGNKLIGRLCTFSSSI